MPPGSCRGECAVSERDPCGEEVTDVLTRFSKAPSSWQDRALRARSGIDTCKCGGTTMARIPSWLIVTTAVALGVLGGGAISAQDKYTVQVPNGLAFSDFR